MDETELPRSLERLRSACGLYVLDRLFFVFFLFLLFWYHPGGWDEIDGWIGGWVAVSLSLSLSWALGWMRWMDGVGKFWFGKLCHVYIVDF